MTTPNPYGAAQALLTAVVNEWTGTPLPDGRWVAEGGSAAWDGDQVTVVVGTVSPGLPGRSQMTPRPRGIFPVSVALTVEIVRNREAGLSRQGGRESVLPTPAENVAAGVSYGADLEELLRVLLAVRQNGSVVRNPTMINVTGVQPTGPQGDLLGVAGTVVVLLGRS